MKRRDRETARQYARANYRAKRLFYGATKPPYHCHVCGKKLDHERKRGLDLHHKDGNWRNNVEMAEVAS